MRKLIVILVILIIGISSYAFPKGKVNIMSLPPYERAVLIIKKYETLHKPCNWPAIGYGHMVKRGEKFRKGVLLSESQADLLLRNDLNKLIALFSSFRPSDALLLGVLSYNIGPGAVKNSSVYRKLKMGDRNIYKSYTSHCHYKGRFHKKIHERRIIELMCLFVP